MTEWQIALCWIGGVFVALVVLVGVAVLIVNVVIWLDLRLHGDIGQTRVERLWWRIVGWQSRDNDHNDGGE